ncbi:MAG: methylenetetrahydrofolate--tRNA-(uracil(54)-C(5))-methyltransferase (FADH(2)-oxidizing) TrmFO [Ruminococcaceae bacterium]|nr:methylenetetrahydrofolate--tRNA-(uracil(54)-C(5))-methyltransferase (FADH(2)-oxidizing) TrmFO [Oscillospiraceae bacterium]
MNNYINVLGAGLAGVEAANIITTYGIKVKLYEMKPKKFTPAHKSNNFAELICSNSLKAKRLDSAAGLLKEEMRRLGSVLVPFAAETEVPAGGALAVDREKFSLLATNCIQNNPLIEVINEEVTDIPDDAITVIATGPLTSDALAEKIKELTGGFLSFFDAAAPIVSFDSIDMTKCFKASRYGKGDDDYINCPMNKEEYEAFYNELINAERAPVHSLDNRDPKVYEGCMPVEIMAKRGADTLRFGPLKPVGLRDPRTGHRPWAVVQLRTEDKTGTMYNLVGFQTNLKFPEQKRVFGMIPGLENAEFLRYGVMHRNTFLNSPNLLDADFSLRSNKNIFFAGQMTGVEGYMESASSGLMAGINAARRFLNKEPFILPATTMIGALSDYISHSISADFQPMGANFGVIPPLETHIRDKKERYAALSQRALDDLSKATENL